jgi:malonyl-CoA O-methyltransferase
VKLINKLTARFASRGLPLSTRNLYDRWAPLYPPLPHNPFMRAEQAAMLRLLPEVRGARVLDLACGSGRYATLIHERGAAFVVGLDFSPVMLARARLANRVRASMMSAPLAPASFDVIVSGLAVGHADDLQDWLCEAARLLMPSGTLLYSDFHPAAAQAGMKRTFRGVDGRHYTLKHRTFTVDQHRNLARAAALSVESISEVRAGIEFTEPFDGSDALYRKCHGTPLVLVVAMRKPPVHV